MTPKHILQFNFTIGFHPLAGLQNLFHNSLGILAFLKFHDHLLGHEVYGRVCNTGRFFCGLLHQVRTVCAVYFDFISLFHETYLRSQLNICLIIMAVVY